MREHRNPRKRLPKPQPPDNRRPALPEPPPEPPPDDEVNCLLYALRDDMRRADAFISTAERQIEENWHDHDDEEDDDVEDEFDTVLRHRMRIEYLVEASKLAVRAALYTTDQLDAALARKRSA